MVFRLSCAAGAALLLCVPMSTPAQTDDAAQSGYAEVIELSEQQPAPVVNQTQLDTLIVHGEKLGRSLRDTSTSVDVIDARDLDDYAKTSLADVLADSVNANANEEGSLAIRGIDQSGAARDGGAPLISVQIDGVTLDGTSQQNALSTLFDVEQVEILRGAQSTSQGRNALAGAVVIKTIDPGWSPELYALGRYGSLDTWQLALAGGGPLSETWAFRFALSHDQSDGFVTHQPDGADDFAASENAMGRFKLLYESLRWPGLRSLLTYSRSHSDGQPDYNMERGTAGTSMRRTSTVNEDTRDRVMTELLSWDTRYSLRPGWHVTSISAVMNTRQDYIRDFDGLEDEGGSNPIYNNGENVTQELRLSIDQAGAFSGVFGVYAGRFRERSDIYSNDVRIGLGSYLPVPVVADLLEVEVDFLNIEHSETNNLALFFEFDLALREWLTATLGLRYDRETLDARYMFTTERADAMIATPDGVASQPLLGDLIDGVIDLLPGVDVRRAVVAAGIAPETDGFQGGKTRYHALLPKLGLRVAVNPRWALFASYTEAYRAGGVDVDSTSGEALSYDPEYTRNYELGARGELANTLALSFNAFYIDWTDQQIPVPTGLFFVTQNAARSRLYGAEIGLRWQITPRWRLRAGLARVDTAFLDYTAGDNDYSGNRFVLAPEHTANLGLVWEHPGGYVAAMNLSHQGFAYTYPQNTPDDISEARQLLSVRLGYRRPHWGVHLTVRNLLDQDYISETYNFPQGYAGADSARGYGAYGAPRTITAMFDWRY